MTSRVKIQIAEPQLLTASQLIEKRLPRFGESVGIGVAQIDEVAVVGQDLLRQEASLVARLLESRDKSRQSAEGHSIDADSW
jgi:hypothetical protein